MSIEEKAKRYDEAIKQIRECTPDENGFVTIYPNEIFPELKDSEDERIRKEIVVYLKSVVSNKKYGDRIIESWIAWLEKQGKEKETPKVAVVHKELNDYLGKQSDQKSTNKIEPKFKVGDKVHFINGTSPNYEDDCIVIGEISNGTYYGNWEGGYFDIKDQDKYELIEQKPTWSEEDETTRNNISHIIRQYDKISKKENQPCWYIGDCLLWIQNIKNRVLLQLKQGWSEEDESKIDSICLFIQEYGDNYYSQVTKMDAINFLKSLKPQNRWKPSEAQMASITCAVRKMKESACYDSELVSLLNDLKKLQLWQRQMANMNRVILKGYFLKQKKRPVSPKGIILSTDICIRGVSRQRQYLQTQMMITLTSLWLLNSCGRI